MTSKIVETISYDKEVDTEWIHNTHGQNMRITELLSDEEYREFQSDLAANPQTGDVVPGLGGLRKIRLALPARGCCTCFF